MTNMRVLRMFPVMKRDELCTLSARAEQLAAGRPGGQSTKEEFSAAEKRPLTLHVHYTK